MPSPVIVCPLQSKAILSAPIVRAVPEQERSEFMVLSSLIVSPQLSTVQPSSTTPSQSLSTLSQTSALEPKNGSQVSEPQIPAEQVSKPVFPLQTPKPQFVGCVKFSSINPSQSLFKPSHNSVAPG